MKNQKTLTKIVKGDLVNAVKMAVKIPLGLAYLATVLTSGVINSAAHAAITPFAVRSSMNLYSKRKEHLRAIEIDAFKRGYNGHPPQETSHAEQFKNITRWISNGLFPFALMTAAPIAYLFGMNALAEKMDSNLPFYLPLVTNAIDLAPLYIKSVNERLNEQSQ